MNILLYIIIAVLGLSTIFLLIKDKRRVIIDNKEEEALMARLHQKEIEGLSQIELTLKEEQEKILKERMKINQELAIEQENLINYKDTKIANIENEIKLFREEQLNLIKQEVLKLDLLEKQKLEEKFIGNKKEYDEKTKNLQIQINETKEQLKNLYEKRQNTLAALKEEEEIKDKANFYRIVLKEEDANDIVQLRSIEKSLHNKDVLRKLIYKTYIEVPMGLMMNRVGIKELPGIYKITNLKNKMVYIGQSTNVKNRVKAHIQASLGISTIASQLVHDKMTEEGLENFTFQMVEQCDRQKLNDREKYWISYYDSNSWGYNRTGGGSSSHF